VKDQNRQR